MKIPKGMEPVVFSYAYYKVIDFAKIVKFFEEAEKGNLFTIDSCNPKKQTFSGAFLREYPKNHWNPASNMPGTMQVVGGLEIKDGIFKVDTKTKTALKEIEGILEEHLGEYITFEKEEFQDIMKMLKKV